MPALPTPKVPIDRTVPLLLFPIRIETKFDVAARRRDLLVRIYPDQVQVDCHRPSLSTGERTHGERFWRAAWNAATPRATLDRQFARLTGRVGAYRAAWTLEATRPLNWESGGAAGVRSGPPQFPPSKADVPRLPHPAVARLLPDRWVVTGYQRQEQQFSVTGEAIPRDLPVAPELAATGQAPRSMGELMEAQGLGWLRDFDAAVAAGMAVRISLDSAFAFGQPLDLFVVGLRHGEAAADTADQIAALLAAHQWTQGVDLVRRGTPTNNTDRARSGISVSAPDLAQLLDLVLLPRAPAASANKPMSRRPFAVAASLALGLAPGSILERVPHRDDRQLDLGGAMNAVLWPATWGQFLRTMVAGAATDPWIDWTRRHFIDQVRGGGTLPTLRVGRQPYGLLPVAAPITGADPVDRVATLERLLLALVPYWADAVEQRVAHLDPDATDLTGTATPSPATLEAAVTALGRTLGATPNPSDLVLRPATDETDTYRAAWGLAIVVLGVALAPFPSIAAALGNDLANAATLEEQIAALQSRVASGGAGSTMGDLWLEAHNAANSDETRAAAQAAIDFIQGRLLYILENHRERTAPLLDLGPNRKRVTGLMADDTDPALFLAFFGEDTERSPWTAPLVASDPGAGAEVAAWLAALAAEAADPATPAVPPMTPAPLLFQLVKRALAVAQPQDKPDLVAGLRTLAAAAGDGRLPDPVGDLEVLMGEVLGTCMHRLDAWLSAAAARRLQALRDAQPLGIQIGGFGWVTGLRRTQAQAASQGFIHAPTLDHAVTAAVLRSGWSALGDGALGVDLSSGRARAATWLVDGLRDGRGLDDLLGQSLERRLHDAGLSRFVEAIRSAVLRVTGQGNRPPNQVTDGLVVARAWIGGDEVAPLTDEETRVRDEVMAVVGGAGADGPALGTVLDAHGADLDAVADAGLAQAVHALVRGNPDQAGAALAGLGSGDGGPAALTALGTPRGGRRITHSLLALFDATDPPTQAIAVSPAALAEPSLEAWLARVLPPLDKVLYGAWIEGDGTRTWAGPLTLAQAGLGLLELLADLPTGGGFAGGPLTARLAWSLAQDAAAAGQVVTIEIDADAGGKTGADELPLRLFLPAALALRGLLHAGRPADAADLAAAAGTSTADVGAVAGRDARLAEAARSAAAALRTALDRDASTAEVLPALTALTRWHLPGTIPSAGRRDLASGTDAADRAALIQEAEAAYARLQGRIDARDGISGDDLTATLARIRALLPGALVLPPFAALEADLLRGAASRSSQRLGGTANALAWLQQCGRVRARVGTATSAVDLVDAATGGERFQPVLIQLPDHAREGWAATTLPTQDNAPRTCLVSLTGLPAAWDRVAGLVIDSWTEVVPDRRAATGIAVHFDAPSAQPPQALLLGLPPAQGTWDVDAVLALVRQTFDRARQRAVGPEEIAGLGQYVPAIYLGDEADPGIAVEAVASGASA
jgi:hypothetical protein